MTDADIEAEAAAQFGRQLNQLRSKEYACGAIVCAFPHDGNCWCFNRALASYVEHAKDVRATNQDTPND
jgi:hypothetical protein